MSRNALVIILILVLIGYGATILYIGPAPPPDNPSKPEAKYTVPMWLSIRSLGEEISVPNETALIEKLEQFAEEDPMCYVATWVLLMSRRSPLHSPMIANLIPTTGSSSIQILVTSIH